MSLMYRLKNLSENRADSLRHGPKANESDLPPKGQAPFWRSSRSCVLHLFAKYRNPYAPLAFVFVAIMTPCYENIPPQFQWFFFGLILLFPLYRSTPVVLGGSLSLLLVLESADLSNTVDSSDYLLALSLSGLIVCTSAWAECLSVRRSQRQPSAIQGMLAPEKPLVCEKASRLASVEDAHVRPQRTLAPLYAWITIGTAIGVSLGCAMVIFALFPLRSEAAQQVRIFPPVFRLMELAVLMLAGYIVLALVSQEIRWRTLTRAQAKIYLRATLCDLLVRDTKAIVRGMQKTKQSMPRNNLDAGFSRE